MLSAARQGNHILTLSNIASSLLQFQAVGHQKVLVPWTTVVSHDLCFHLMDSLLIYVLWVWVKTWEKIRMNLSRHTHMWSRCQGNQNQRNYLPCAGERIKGICEFPFTVLMKSFRKRIVDNSGDWAPQLRMLAALAKDLNLVPSLRVSQLAVT